jgi:hypothetical protein
MWLLPLLLWLCATVRGANVVTECNQQLHNYYVALGVPFVTPVQQALIFTAGVFLGTPFVQIENRLQEAARFYDALLPSPPGNQSYVAYLTVDIPWCTTAITQSCLSNETFGLAKTSNCTTLPDYNLGPPSLIAGRLFLYQNQSATSPCNGSAFITFFNVTLSGSGNNTYTYDVVGIQQQREMTWVEATNTYRASTCAFSDGDPADVVTQAQFVCEEPGMFCNGTRPPGPPTLQVIPIPELACIGFANFNSSYQTVIWKVSSFQPQGGLDGQYGATFVTDLAFATGAELAYLAQGQFYLLISGTVRQLDSHIDSLSQYGLFYYESQWTNFQPVYALSKNAQFAAVPCLCGFSMFCDAQGNADVTSMYTGFTSPNNALPICNPGPDQQVAFGTPQIVITANASSDPDNGPYPFNVYWFVLSTPYDPSPPPFNLSDPTQLTQVINSTGFLEGTYLFGLYASDLQVQVPCTLNVTIIPNQVFAVVENDKIVTFAFYSGQTIGHPCSDYPPSPAISLNGSYSHATNPASPLYYLWSVYSGDLDPFFCDPFGFSATSAFFNTTEPIAYFVPPLPTTYCFQLNVTDNITVSSSAILCVTVNPDFQQPNSTFTPLANFTAPPIRDFNFTNRTIVSQPPFQQPPFVTHTPIQGPPSAPSEGNTTPAPTNTTPFFPPVPPRTFGDSVVWWVWWAVVLALWLFFFYMVQIYQEEGFFRKYEKKRYGGAYGHY